MMTDGHECVQTVHVCALFAGALFAGVGSNFDKCNKINDILQQQYIKTMIITVTINLKVTKEITNIVNSKNHDINLPIFYDCYHYPQNLIRSRNNQELPKITRFSHLF